jgi:hypothetical protein
MASTKAAHWVVWSVDTMGVQMAAKTALMMAAL